MKIEIIPEGVCAKRAFVTLDDDLTIKDITLVGGCKGNTAAINTLLQGHSVEDLYRLEDNRCGYKGTSCMAEVARAVRAALENK